MNETTTTTTTTTVNPIMELLQNRFRDVTTTDPIKGDTTTYRAVTLRASDFSTKSEWKTYSERVLRFAPLMQAVAIAQDGKEDEAFFTARKNALDALTHIFGLLANIAQYPKFNATKKDVNYILKFAYMRKVDREGRSGTLVTVKSKAALQALIEDLMYYHVNHMKVPEAILTATVENSLAKLDAVKAENTEAPKAESKPKSNKPKAESAAAPAMDKAS